MLVCFPWGLMGVRMVHIWDHGMEVCACMGHVECNICVGRSARGTLRREFGCQGLVKAGNPIGALIFVCGGILVERPLMSV